MGPVAEPAMAGADAGPSAVATRPAALTARQGEIARLIGRGLSNRRIAAALARSERTVEWHVANILEKLRLESRVQVAVWAVERGLTAERPPLRNRSGEA
jgi:two-component system nitrate/nitrite response regulator NarL